MIALLAMATAIAMCGVAAYEFTNLGAYKYSTAIFGINAAVVCVLCLGLAGVNLDRKQALRAEAAAAERKARYPDEI